MKGEQVELSDFLRHMAGIQRCQAQLSSLDDAWEHIKRLAEVSCPEEAKTILPSMERTQAEFKDLQRRLIENLIKENLRKAAGELAAKAQIAVDILIRNLYERTADVGFLATDGDLRRFIADPEPGPENISATRKRLEDYAAKYTVYEEIILLDASGVVKVNLDGGNPIAGRKIDDPLIAQTLASNAPYVETFRRSPLQESRRQSLIYSKRITAPGADESSPPVGVLCLCFKFENELSGIFNGLRKDGDKSHLMILDRGFTVIAGSDTRFAPIGTVMEGDPGSEFSVVEFYGREYIACVRPAKGYQGYSGLGWLGYAVIPCDFAFKADPSPAEAGGAAKNLDLGIEGFSASLGDIVRRAELINLGLRRVVWNGQIMAGNSDSRLKPVLAQISKTGAKTISLFSDSIKSLRSTIVSSSLGDAKSHARLAIDIMDRNLYERSDDCRWWALNPDFRRILSSLSVTDSDLAAVSETLACLNSLYTVYSGLFLFDRTGKVLGISSNSLAPIVGQRLDSDFVRQVLRLNNPQHYAVSPFADSRLYANRPTYIYGAPVLELGEARKTVGGIGIVFDSEPQFEAMLRDALPAKEGCHGVFTDRGGGVISSSSDACKPGSRLELPAERFFSLPNGGSLSEIVEFGGRLCIVGCACSGGYREYKNSGDYKNDVLAFIFVELGGARAEPAAKEKSGHAALAGNRSSVSAARKGVKSVELATFLCSGRRMAFEKERVVESVSCERITSRIPGAAEYLEGTLAYNDRIVPAINLRVICGMPKRLFDIYTQTIIIRLARGGMIGVVVDDLDDVPEYEEDMVEPIPAIISGDAGYVCKLVKSSDNASEMMMVLDPDLLLKAARSGLHPNNAPITAPKTAAMPLAEATA